MHNAGHAVVPVVFLHRAHLLINLFVLYAHGKRNRHYHSNKNRILEDITLLYQYKICW